MKTKLSAATLAVILTATGATAIAHERYDDGIRVIRTEHYGGGYVRYNEPVVYYDRYGNRVITYRDSRGWSPIGDHCRRPVVVEPHCRPVPVYEPACRTYTRSEPHFVGALRFIFGR